MSLLWYWNTSFETWYLNFISMLEIIDKLRDLWGAYYFSDGISVIGGGWIISLKGGVIYFLVLGFNSIFSDNIWTLFTIRNLFWSCWIILNKYNLYRFNCGFLSILPSEEPLIKFLSFLYISVMLHEKFLSTLRHNALKKCWRNSEL